VTAGSWGGEEGEWAEEKAQGGSSADGFKRDAVTSRSRDGEGGGVGGAGGGSDTRPATDASGADYAIKRVRLARVSIDAGYVVRGAQSSVLVRCINSRSVCLECHY
jgi:hypothetical protein